MHSRGGSNCSPPRLRAPPRLPGAYSSTLVDLAHPMSFTLIRVQPFARSSSQSYHGYRRSNIPSPQRSRKRRTVSSSVPIKKSCGIFVPCFLTHVCTTSGLTNSYPSYHEHCREDVHWSHSCRTHPQQFDTIVESDPCSGFSQPY